MLWLSCWILLRLSIAAPLLPATSRVASPKPPGAGVLEGDDFGRDRLKSGLLRDDGLGPIAYGGKTFPGNASQADASGSRQLTSYSFFEAAPYVNILAFDSHGAYCSEIYNTMVSDCSADACNVKFPQDGTKDLIQSNMACGIAIARFVVTTSDLPAYTDTAETAKMQIRITCALSSFIESLGTCESILGATGGLPRVASCVLSGSQAILVLSTRLSPSATYSFTLKLVNPDGGYDSENTFDMTIEYEGTDIIEGTMSPQPMITTSANVKDTSIYDHGTQWSNFWKTCTTACSGYVTSFFWASDADLLYPDTTENLFRFGVRTFGKMDSNHLIDVVAYPTNVWRFGAPGDGCVGFAAAGAWSGMTSCSYMSFAGASSQESNGFRISFEDDFSFLGESDSATFEFLVTTPVVPVNMFWTATSYKRVPTRTEPYTVLLDKPVVVLGTPSGYIARWDLAALDVEQWVTLELYPGNVVMPNPDIEIESGQLVIIPPSTFSVVETQDPQDVEGYNALPCSTWEIATDPSARFTCRLGTQTVFADTAYRVQLSVRNPLVSGAARAWRIELWQVGINKPVSISRQIRGMPVFGSMLASVAPSNQLLTADNTIRFAFTPSQDIGTEIETRLDVVAPAGFVIIKRCFGFNRIFLPLCSCVGNDGNEFKLIFQELDAIKGGTQYIFDVQVTNPNVIVADEDNYWTFNTMRPDGLGKDTARYEGFDLFTTQFLSFNVTPAVRYAGPQQMVVTFKPSTPILLNDYIRIRAPEGIDWYFADLGFTSSGVTSHDIAMTSLGYKSEAPNELELRFQGMSGGLGPATASLEYGLTARCTIPTTTPTPNRWWIEHYRNLGDGTWTDIASMGAEGFKTQVLVNVEITPSSIVSEDYDNPTLIVFQPSTDVLPVTLDTASGSQVTPAELLIEAPPGFTYICQFGQLPTTTYPPDNTQAVPSDTYCEVDHTSSSDQNILHVYFPSGIEDTGLPYAFTIDVINARTIDPTTNVWTLTTRMSGVMVETITYPGYVLADRMDNTRYYPYPSTENRQSEALVNQVTFIIGTIAEITEVTSLEVVAPVGYRFNYDCTSDVFEPTWAPTLSWLFTLPTPTICQSQEWKGAAYANVVDIQMTGSWSRGSHAITLTVANPQFDPIDNYWRFTIWGMSSSLPLASAAWVFGFNIQAVLNPAMNPYNPANGMAEEAAINPVEISFEVITGLAASASDVNIIHLTTPEGFQFPSVCQDFVPNTRSSTAMPLPDSTACTGDGAQKLNLTLPSWWAMNSSTRYAFRINVINPMQTFVETNVQGLWWSIETSSNGATQDRNLVIPSFPVYQRLEYFSVDTLSNVGHSITTYRVHFQLSSALEPLQTISIYPPEGTTFNGTLVDGCVDPGQDTNEISLLFPEVVISGVEPLPEWIVCRVVSTGEVQLTNVEDPLSGRSLQNASVYEFFVQNVSNAQRTPDINLFRIVARTNTEFGQEVWTSDGWTIFPQLSDVSVSSSNPAVGVYTNFTFHFVTVTEVPAGGYIQITAPTDYYFGPELVASDDPLASLPPEQGIVDVRTLDSEVTDCTAKLIRPDSWVCPFDFQTCIDQADYEEQGVFAPYQKECSHADFAASVLCTRTYCQWRKNDDNSGQGVCMEACAYWQEQCDIGEISQLMTCESQGSTMTITLADGVLLPAGHTFDIFVEGYNARTAAENETVNTWYFATRFNDVGRTLLDERKNVPGIQLLSVVHVVSIVPEDTRVESYETRVTITLRLMAVVRARALLRITHPEAFLLSTNTANTGTNVEVGTSFPKNVQTVQSLNRIELISYEENFAADVDLQITVLMTNPAITPVQVDNIWTFEVFSRANVEDYVLVGVHRFIKGYKVFGAFSTADVFPTVLAPTALNPIGIHFQLKSLLPESSTNPPTNYLRIHTPLGITPQGCSSFFAASSTTTTSAPVTTSALPLSLIDGQLSPQCTVICDTSTGLCYLQVTLDGVVDNGQKYAFQFTVTNPMITPADDVNVWRFETYQDNILLHLETSIPGFEVFEMQKALLVPQDSTSLRPLNLMHFEMMSERLIPGGSLILIKAPSGFIFTCAQFLPSGGLAKSTSCFSSAQTPNQVRFLMDAQNPLQPETDIILDVYVSNPEFTPESNYWIFEIREGLVSGSSLDGGMYLDVRNNIPGFDITGAIQASIDARFPFLNQRNPLHVVFVQSTILNMAETGNELVLTGPVGYIFPRECTQAFQFRFTNDVATEATEGYTDAVTSFPPDGLECMGFGNSTVIIRLPNGSGLLRNNYTLQVDVDNPATIPNATNTWSLITRVRTASGQRIVDANDEIAGFRLNVLTAVNLDEGLAMRCPPWQGILLVLVVLLQSGQLIE